MDIRENAKAGKPIVEVINEDVCIWVEQEAIHLKAIDSYGDPVELTGESARLLAAKLLEMARRLND